MSENNTKYVPPSLRDNQKQGQGQNSQDFAEDSRGESRGDNRRNFSDNRYNNRGYDNRNRGFNNDNRGGNRNYNNNYRPNDRSFDRSNDRNTDRQNDRPQDEPVKDREGVEPSNEDPTPSNDRGANDTRGGYNRGGYGNRGGDRYDNRGGDRYDNRGGDRYDNRSGDRYDNRGGDRYDNRGGYGNRGGDRYDNRGGYDRYDNRGGYGNRGGYDRRSSNYGKKNSLGFHGEMVPNTDIEHELFFKQESQTAGINFSRYDNIPVEVSNGSPEPYNEFSEETIGPQLLKNLVLTKFHKPTPIQKYSIPIGLAGGDMMACAQTGSGKTAGFLFPLIAVMTRSGPLYTDEDYKETKERYPRACIVTALVLAPTRELAIQIYEEAQKFCYCTGIRPVVIYGGAPPVVQLTELSKGADILIATPGRLEDFLSGGNILLDYVRFLVLDEADRMLDMGFEPQIRSIVNNNNMPSNRQTFMFSATFPSDIQRLASDFMKDYVFVAVGRVGSASKDVTQRIIYARNEEKSHLLVDALSNMVEGLILVFVETRKGADQLENFLNDFNFPACSIHGDKSQKDREDSLRLFKSGKNPILVATDVAARGLDIPNVTQVINYDMPNNIEDYVHRIGRTGRVGNVGHALSFFNEKNSLLAKELVDLLVENQQDLPDFLDRMIARPKGGPKNKSNGQSSGSKFGAKDIRKEVSNTPKTSGSGSGVGNSVTPSFASRSKPVFQSSSEDWDNSAW